MAGKATLYWDYIKLEELLSLQTGVEPDESELENDEVMFITIHQIDELWFKLAIRELVRVRNLFAQEKVREQSLSDAVRGIRRTALLFDQVAHHFRLMETMTTRDYLGFRDKLSPASGFQSAQLREIEILMGLKVDDRIPLGHDNSYLRALRYPDGRPSPASQRVEARLKDVPTLLEAINEWLHRTPIQGSTPEQEGDTENVRRFVENYLKAQAIEAEEAMILVRDSAPGEADRRRIEERYKQERIKAREFLLAEEVPEEDRPRVARVRAALLFIESYRELPLLAWPREVLDGLVELEQAFVIFRQRHARMVERVIGRRTGTGGSAGVDYLEQTALRYRVFRELWAVRTLMIRKTALPPLRGPDVYGFVAKE
ncbi:Tryptophan 2,3-dioxygenase holoenzyme [Nannocystis exedens]|uniref:Tryptophan 2,3-dioxygenase n=1 Tax=Nannocystis exedens TaxID=54 RepID=A0A1I2DM38_9BACT|nr:tryptophan 2,3-dioxygenase family protein [Nannocystis exedens]PCC69063.1 tryptophan 2,3-dioxygenase [Nannocystis exedens]SFE81489.1 Tryptophan 2,3-dioxygenase holoenzyme [Nannocystis exedens]